MLDLFYRPDVVTAFSSTSLSFLAFWISGAVLAYTFVGYGILMTLLARNRKVHTGAPTSTPDVCAIIVAHNEEARISARIENLLASDYPPAQLRILLVSDGSTDGTVARAQALDSNRVTILTQRRTGKAAGLNLALAHAASEIVVFTDARQQFAPDAIARLASHFGDPTIGAVSGALEIAQATSSAGAGIDAYWRYEKALRTAESVFDSCIGCTGAIYAIRRIFFRPIPVDTLLDDVVLPMQIAARGARVIHDFSAQAFDPQALEPAAEQSRKQRTLAGNFQMLFRYPEWLLPWRHRLWWQLISHKYLRLAAPFFLVAAFASNVVLTNPFYRVALFTQSLFYAAAALGFLPGLRRVRILAVPAGFAFLNLMTLRGLHHYLTVTNNQGWK